jgi:hypothetical protein
LGRHNGFHSVIQKYPHIQYVDYLNKDWADKDLRGALRQKLKSNPDLTDLIFAHNDRCALIAYDVCKELGIEKKIKFIGVDGLVGNNLGLDLVKKVSSMPLFCTLQVVKSLSASQPKYFANRLLKKKINFSQALSMPKM